MCCTYKEDKTLTLGQLISVHKLVTVNNDLFPTHIQTVKEVMERKGCTSLVFETLVEKSCKILQDHLIRSYKILKRFLTKSYLRA